jgi:hypothetical protein
MDWFYGGYLTSCYAALGVVFVLALPSHDEPWLLALACFVLIPGLIVGASSMLEGFLAHDDGVIVDRSIRSGRLSRRRVFVVGAIAAITALGVLSTIFLALHSLRASIASVWIIFVLGSAVLASSPPLGVWWLKQTVKAASATAIHGSTG